MHSEKVSNSQKLVGKSAQRQPLSALSKTCAVALLGDGLACVFEFLLAFIVAGVSWVTLLPLLIFALITWITAGLILVRVRWAPAVGVVVGLVAFLYLLVPATRSGLLHPAASPLHFALLVVTFAFALLAVITGLAATLQRSQGSAQPAPRWLQSLLSGVLGLVVGMIIVASLVGATPQNSPATTTTNGMPTVHMAGSRFLTNTIQVPKGASIMIIDDDGVEHIIQNGSWAADGTPQQQAEPGAPALHGLDIKDGSTTIGPFATAGVFHLYCTIHRGMNLTVEVQ